MESLTPKSHRRPLKLLNSPVISTPNAVQVKTKLKPTLASTTVTTKGGNENKKAADVVEDVVVEVSLAEELGAVRRRREKMRMEREKTEKALREMDLVMEREMREIERRDEERRKAEAEVRSFIAALKDPMLELELRLLLLTRPISFQSLREKEREKKGRETQVAEEINGKKDSKDKSTENRPETKKVEMRIETNDKPTKSTTEESLNPGPSTKTTSKSRNVGGIKR